MTAYLAAQQLALKATYGASKHTDAPASFKFAIFAGDPRKGGVEMDAAGGYAAVTVTNNGTNFPAPADGQVTGAFQTFPTSTGAWTAAGVAADGTHWLLRDATTNAWYDSGELEEVASVDVAGVAVSARPIVFYFDDPAV